jgi:hypothetical protein
MKAGGGKSQSQATAALDAPILGLRYGQCRYVTGTDIEGWATFCCEPVSRGSYCRTHYKMCYKPVPKAVKSVRRRSR